MTTNHLNFKTNKTSKFVKTIFITLFGLVCLTTHTAQAADWAEVWVSGSKVYSNSSVVIAWNYALAYNATEVTVKAVAGANNLNQLPEINSTSCPYVTTLTLDLNGKIWGMNGTKDETKDYFIRINKAGFKLIIKDDTGNGYIHTGWVSNTGSTTSGTFWDHPSIMKCVQVSAGTLELQSGGIKAKNAHATGTIYDTYAVRMDGGAMVMKGGTVEAYAPTRPRAICNSTASLLNIGGGTITATAKSIDGSTWGTNAIAIYLTGAGKAQTTTEFSSLTINADASATARGVLANGTSEANIKGNPTFNIEAHNGDVARCVETGGTATATIDGAGTFNATTSGLYPSVVCPQGGTINVKGGTFKAHSAGGGVYCIYATSGGIANIKGGTYESKITASDKTDIRVAYAYKNSSKINISGGTFTAKRVDAVYGTALYAYDSGQITASGNTTFNTDVFCQANGGPIVVNGGNYSYVTSGVNNTNGGTTTLNGGYYTLFQSNLDANKGSGKTVYTLSSAGLDDPHYPTYNYLIAPTGMNVKVKVGNERMYYTELNSALDTAKQRANPTIELMGNTTFTGPYTLTSPVTAWQGTLDLKTYTITSTLSSGDRFFSFDDSDAKLTITGTTGQWNFVAGYAGALFGLLSNYGEVALTGGKLYTQNTTSGKQANCVFASSKFTQSGGTVEAKSASDKPVGIRAANGGIVNISGGTVKAVSTSGSYPASVWMYVTSGTSIPSVTVDGGTLQATAESGSATYCFLKDNGTLTINNGTIEATSSGNYTKTIYNAAGNVEINGGTFSAQATDGPTCLDQRAGTVTINGGSFTTTGTTSTISLQTLGGTLNVQGGSFTATSGTGGYGINVHSSGSGATVNVNSTSGVPVFDVKTGINLAAATGTVNVSAGKFKCTTDVVAGTAGSTASFSGGYFNEKSGTTFKTQVENRCADGKHAVDLSGSEKAAPGMSDYSYKVVSAYAVTYGTHTNGDFTIKVEDGDASSATKYAASGQTVTLAATANTHYHFVRWNASGGSPTWTPSRTSNPVTFAMPAADVTISATISGDEYDITYTDPSGDNPITTWTNYSDLPKKHTYGTATVLPNATKTGYTFGGWYTDAACTASAGTSIGATARTADFTLYAKWTVKTYTITLDKKEGTANGTATVNFGATSFATHTPPTRTGYHVDGYYKETGLTNIIANADGTLRANTAYTTSTNWKNDGNVTLYTKWAENSYDVTFNNGGHGTIKVAGNTVENGATYSVSHFSAKTLVATASTGYTFSGWTKTGSVTITDASAASTYITAQAAGGTVTATWTAISSTVTLNNQSATTAGQASVTATYGSAMPSIASNKPAKTDYTFGGYYTSTAGGGTQYYNTSGTSARNWDKTSATTLYAKWTQTLTLNGNGATNTPTASVTATFNGGIGSIATLPSRTNYTFQGYYTASDGSGSQVINASGALQTNVSSWTNSSTQWIHASASTLYAKFTQAVTLNANTANHGSGDNKSATAVYNAASLTGFTATAAATGYKLNGYWTAATGGTKVLNANGGYNTATVADYITSGKWSRTGAAPTLYAQMSAKQCTVTFDKEGGSGGSDNATATYDAAMTTITPPTRANYEFAGYWDGDNGTGTQYYKADGTSARTWNKDTESNTTLYAKWTSAVASVTIGGATTYHATLAGAFTKANSAASAPTITLLANCSSAAVLTFAPTNAVSGTLNLNGKTLSGTVDKVLTINKSGQTFTITDSSNGQLVNTVSVVNDSCHAVWVTAGTLAVNKGVVKMNNTNASGNAQARAIYVKAGATATISGSASIQAISEQKAYGIKTEGTTATTTTLTVSGGSISAETRTAATAYGVWMRNTAFTMSAGTINATAETSTARGVYIEGTAAKATMRLTGGTITATTNTANSAYGIHLNWAISGDNPGLTIPTGSTVSVTATAQTTAAYTIYTSWATSTIQAGTFRAETKTGNSAVGFYGDYHNSTTISGGTWTVISGAKWAWGAQANRGTINISGGTFNVSGSSEIAGVYAYATTTTSTTDNTYNSIINISGSPVFTVEATSSAWGVFANHNGSGTSVGHAGTVNVSGGTFNVTSTSAKGIYVAAAGSYASGNSTPKANISGGKFNVSGSSAVATSTTAENTNEVITGGYYSVNGGLSNYTHPTKDCNYRVFTISPALESKYNYKVAQFYTIAYNKGANGTGTEYTDYKAHGDNITLRGAIFTRTGYTQTAWNTNSAGTGGTSYALSATYSSNAALTLYPTWTAKTTTVTLNANTANHGSGANQSVTATYGSALPSFTATTAATGYHLVGYYTAATSGTKIINADGTFAANSGIWNRTDGATLTLYAHYEANTYTITFNANGGTLNTTSVTATYNSSTLASITNPTWTGFTFTGWWTNTSSGTLVINTSGALQANVSGYTGAGGIWTATEGKTLYAQWTPNPYSITLDKNNSDAGSTSGSATAVYWNTSLGSITAPTRTGYTVEGYYKEAGCTNKIATDGGALQASTTYTDATNRWTSTSNQTLYTKWTEKSYDVTFYNGGHGTVKVAGSTVANGTTAKANHFTTKTLVAEAATGYDFNGWTKTGSVTIGNTANASTNIKATAAGGTVTATWTAHSYTISYDLAGGSVASANPANYTIESSAITLNNPTKVGYTFAGWTGTGLASATTTVTIAAGSTGNRSYTATWSANTNTAYTVRHYKQNLAGSGYDLADTDNLTGTTGASVTPARKSYTGFTAPSGTTVTIAADGSTVVTYNYTRNSYTLTWNKGTGNTLTGSYTSGSVKYGASITAPNTPTKNADASYTYTFSGWHNGTSIVTPATTMPANDLTYTAQFSTTANVASVTPSGGSPSYYTTIGEAFTAANAASANVTIKLLANCSSAAVLTFAPTNAVNGTLDLNNKTLSGSVDKVLTINKSGQTFTITDTNGTKKGKLVNTVNSNSVIYAVWVSAGGLTINCDTIRMDNTSTGTSAQARTIHLTTNTPLTINGGSVEAISRQSAYGVYAEGATNTTNQKPLITISGGNVKATTRTAATAYGVWMDRARFILNSGSVTATAQTNTAYAVYNKGGQITLNGGTLTAETLTEGSAFGIGTGWVSSNSMTFSVPSTSTVTVNATAKTTGAYALNLNYSDNTIQGGTFNATTLEGTNARGISSSTHFIRISGSPVFNVEAGRDLAVGDANKSLAYGIVCSRTGYYASGTGAEVIDSVYITGTPVFNVETDSIAYGILASASVSKTAVPTESYNTHFNISGGTYNVTARKTAYGVQAHRNGVKDVADKAPVATQGHVVVYDGEFIVSAAGALGICTSRPATYTDSNGSATGTPTITVKGGKFNVSGTSAKAAYSHNDVNGITQQILGGYYSINGNLAASVVSPKRVFSTTAADKASVGSAYNYKVVTGYAIAYKKGSNGTGTEYTDYKAHGDNITLRGVTFTRSGYTQNGWSTSDGGSKAYNLGGTYSTNEDLTLYPTWTENGYTVTVTAGSHGSVASGSVTGHKDTKVTLPTATANTGYHFSTWTTTSGSVTYTNQTSATAAQVNGLTAAATVRADFAANTYQVRFNGNGSTGGSMSNESFTYDAAAKALTANAFTKTNYHFIGWATSAGGDVVYADGASVRNLTATNNGVYDLYAKWAIDTYTVTITKNNDSYGTITSTSITGVPHGTTITVSSNTVTINGTTVTATAASTTAQYSYAFNNWTKGDGTALPATVTGAITVRANFTRTARTYTVTLNTNGGTINAGNVTSYTYGTGATLPTNVTKTGYTFAGWYDNSELTGSAVTTISTSATGNKTYWAKWTAATLRFTKAGGGNWNVASNWTPACVPTAAHDVNIETPCTVTSTDAVAKSVVIDKSSSKTGQLVIAAGQALNVTSTIQLKNASSELVATTPSDLVILSSEAANNASLVFSNSTTSGNQATVYMYSKAEGYDSHWYWQYVGTPFVGTLANPNYAGSWLYRWKDDCTGWEAVYNENTIDQWTGYCLTQPAETTLEMEGRLLPTTELVNLNFPEGALNGTPKVFANSWTAPIQITQMDEDDFTNVVATIYLFNTGNNKDKVYATGSAPGTYISIPINAAGTDGLPDKISSMQGFYVQKLGTEPSATVTLDYSKHVRPSGVNTIVNGPMYAPKRSGFEPEWMKVAVQGSRYGANIYLFAREDFTRGFDNGWDGENLNSAGAAPLLYSAREDGTKDAISAIPEFEGAVVAFQAGEDSEYTFSFKYNGDDVWYLNDLQTQTSTRISVNNTYTFRTSDNDETRFIISATPLAKVIEGTESIQDSAVSVQKQLIKDKLYIKVHTRTYDATGKLVESK